MGSYRSDSLSLFSFMNEIIQTITTNSKISMPPTITASDNTPPAVVFDVIPRNSKNAENIKPTSRNAFIIYCLTIKIPAVRAGIAILMRPRSTFTFETFSNRSTKFESAGI